MCGVLAPTFPISVRSRRIANSSKCVAEYSIKSAVCRLCLLAHACKNKKKSSEEYNRKFKIMSETFLGHDTRDGVVDPKRACRRCKFVITSAFSGSTYDKCGNDKVQSHYDMYCEIERRIDFGACGVQGKLWKPIPPSIWRKLKEHMSRHILGPEEHRKMNTKKGLMKMLREAVKGPEETE